MSNNPRVIKEESTTPVTIAPAKTSLKYIKKRIRTRNKTLLSARYNMQTYFLKILKVIPEGDAKGYMFCEQQAAQEAEVERCEKDKSEERQRKVQDKYQQLKQDREQQQKQKQQKKK